MIRITNTLKTGETKLPKLGSKIRMFVCGPTVYDYIHIGNARTFVVFDVIAKYLRYRGYDLKYIQNITDVDDKIIGRAQETGQNWKKVAERFEKIFLDDMKSLKVDSVDKYPRATKHIKEIIRQVKTLIEKRNAYLIRDDGYYFDLKTFPEYGKLSGRTTEMAEDAVSRIDKSTDKRNKGDFCLWKLSKEGEPSWKSELGTGRPGWHIEDTAITEKYFGPQYEIHGGGQDLIFPHHEAEIAQQESASGLKPFVRYWLHVGFLTDKGGKMSKSLGKFLTVEETLKKYSPEALRFFFLSAHYRSPLDYTEENLKQAEAAVNRLAEFLSRLEFTQKPSLRGASLRGSTSKLAPQPRSIEETWRNFENEMDDDFNTAKAAGYIFDLVRVINPLIDSGELAKDDAKKIIDLLKRINKILSIIPSKPPETPDTVKELVQEREEARRNKDFARADQLRQQIKNLGYEVEDTAYGPLLRRR